MPSLIARSRRPDITIKRMGLIYVSARVSRLLALEPGYSLDVIMQADGECMLLGRPHAPGFANTRQATLRRFNNAGITLRTNCAQLARALLDLVPGSPDSVAFPCGAVVPQYCDGRPAIPIITKNPL